MSGQPASNGANSAAHGADKGPQQEEGVDAILEQMLRQAHGISTSNDSTTKFDKKRRKSSVTDSFRDLEYQDAKTFKLENHALILQMKIEYFKDVKTKRSKSCFNG